MEDKEREALIVDQIPSLRRYARALTLNRESADELVQDCLERAWSRFDTWQAGSNLRAWLFTIMHNTYVNMVRRQNNGPSFVSIEGREFATKGHDPMVLRDLEVSLAALSEEQREIIILAGLEQMSYSEISKILGVPMGTVMSRLSRSRDRLRRLMSMCAKSTG